MKLTDLNPRWVGAGGPGISDKDGNLVPAREGVGISFDCPCGCSRRGYVDLENPLDGLPRTIKAPKWARIGEDFETLTLKPSLLRSKANGGCGWHGFITDGNIVEA